MFIPPGDVALFIRWNLTGDPEPMFTTIGYSSTLDPTLITTATINAFDASFYGFCAADMSAEWSLGPSHVLVGQDGGPPLKVSGNTTSAVGTASGSTVPQNTAILVRKIGALSGRENSGRMYIPGVIESFVGPSGLLSTAAIGVWQANVNTLMPDGVPVGILWPGADSSDTDAVVFHATASPAPSPIAALQVQALVATQRRRLRK